MGRCLARSPLPFFEMICLEGAQAGLSWWTVLQKRERYREVFKNFVPEKVAKMTDALSKALKKAGFNFVGSTVAHAFMQATGMVDDHAEECMKSE